MSLQGGAGQSLYKPEDMEKRWAEQKEQAARDLKLRCLEIASRTHPGYELDEIITAAKKYLTLVNS